MRCVEMVNGPVRITGEDRNRGILIAVAIFTSEIVLERAISGAQQTQPAPATGARVRSQGRRIGCGDDREIDLLGNVLSDAVYAIDPCGAHRTRLGLTFPVLVGVSPESKLPGPSMNS